MDPINQTSGGSKKGLYIGIGIVAILVLGYLMRNSFGMTRSVNVGGYNAEVTKKLDGSTTYKSDYGTATVGSNKWPDNWPTDVPKYSNSTITTAGTTNAQAGLEAFNVVFTTSDSSQTVLDFYKSGLTSSGWASLYPGQGITGTQVGANISLSVKKEKRSFNLVITDLGGGQTRATLMTYTMPEVKTGL